MDTTLTIDPTQSSAISVNNAFFEWIGMPEDEPASFKKASSSAKAKSKAAAAKIDHDKAVEAAAEPFKIRELQMDIPKGSLVAIVGTVGSGKSSLLQGLIGEMKIVSGTVSFSGKVCCPFIHLSTILEQQILITDPFAFFLSPTRSPIGMSSGPDLIHHLDETKVLCTQTVAYTSFDSLAQL